MKKNRRIDADISRYIKPRARATVAEHLLKDVTRWTNDEARKLTDRLQNFDRSAPKRFSAELDYAQQQTEKKVAAELVRQLRAFYRIK